MWTCRPGSFSWRPHLTESLTRDGCSKAIASLVACIVLTATGNLALRAQEDHASQFRSLEEEQLGRYAFVRSFLHRVHNNREEEQLARILKPYGIPAESTAAKVLLQEARLAARILARPHKPLESFDDERSWTEHKRGRLLSEAEVLGRAWGRFLRELRNAGLNDKAVEPIIREQLSISVLYSEADEPALLRSIDAKFDEGFESVRHQF